MGKLLNKNVEFIDRCIDDRKKLDYTQYSKFLDNAPIYTTWYNQSRINSTTDEGFGNTNEFAGDDSSIRFNKIENVPLFSVGTTQIDLNEDESGIKPGFTSEGILLPGMFMPIPNDYFIIDYMDRHVLFRITEVSPGTIKSNEYYKVSFKFYKIETDGEVDIETQVTDSFVAIYDNIGTENRVVIEKEVYQKVEYLMELNELLKNEYNDLFFVKKYNSFICEYDILDTKRTFYNKYLTKFIIINELYRNDNSFITTYLQLEVKEEKNFRYNYSNTLFSAFENNSIEKFKNSFFYMFPTSICDINSTFYGRFEQIYSMDLYKEKSAEFIIPMISDESIKQIIEDDLILELNDKRNIIIKFINLFIHGKSIDDKTLDLLSEFPAYYNSDLYILMPISIYILKKIINNLLKYKSK